MQPTPKRTANGAEQLPIAWLRQHHRVTFVCGGWACLIDGTPIEAGATLSGRARALVCLGRVRWLECYFVRLNTSPTFYVLADAADGTLLNLHPDAVHELRFYDEPRAVPDRLAALRRTYAGST